MKLNKQIIIFLLLIVLFSCVSVVCAHDVDNKEINMVNVNEEESLEIGMSENSIVNDDMLCEEETASNDVIYVDSNYEGGDSTGSEDHPYVELSDALRFSSPDKKIYLKNGSYAIKNKMEFNNGVSIIGEDADGVIINSYVVWSSTNKFMFKFNLNNDCLNLTNITFIGHRSGINAPVQPLVIQGTGNFTMDGCKFSGFSHTNTMDINVNNSKINNSDFSDSGKIIYNQYGYHFLENVILPEVNVNNLNCTLTFNNVTSNKQIKSNGIIRIFNSKFRDVQQDYVFYNDGGNLTLQSSIIENCNVRYLLFENSNESISKLNYNNFISNTIKNEYINAKGDNDDFNYNWWDMPSKPLDNIDYWTVMNVTYEKYKNVGIFNVEFKYSNGENLLKLNELNPGFDVLFKSSVSTLNNVISTNNGVISLEFIPKGDSYINISCGSIHNQISFGNVYVDANFDGEELGTINNPYKTISNALLHVKDWETIFVNDGIYNFENVATISKSINIIGQSIDGVILTGGQRGIFTTPTFMGNDIFIHFSNLNFINTSCDSTHTALNLAQSFVGSLLSNCKFENCSGQHGSLMVGRTSTIENCKFLNSKTTANDGGAGAIYLNGEGTVKISNTIISNTKNDAEYMYGVIYANDKNSIISMENCSILNTCGVVFGIVNTNGFANINNSKICANILQISEDYDTSLICAQNDGHVVVELSEIYDNYADYLINSINQGSNITLNYNLMFNNSCQLVNGEGNHDLNANWWGTNEKPNDEVDNWVIMDVKFRSNFGLLYVNVYFNKCFDGEGYQNLNKNLDFIDFEYNLSSPAVVYHYKDHDQINIQNVEWVDVISNEAKIRYENVPVDVYVDCNYDGEELGTVDHPFKSIRKAIDNVTNRGNIHIKNGDYFENLNGIRLYDVNLVGESSNGVKISLTEESTIRFINVTFKELTLTGLNGIVTNGIGGPSSCTFESCNFINLTSSSDNLDYIINSKLGKLNVVGCNFTSSYSEKNRVPIHLATGDKLIKDCLFNSLVIDDKAYKGLIYIESYTNVEIDNLTISDCSMQKTSLIYSEGNINIKNSKFINNDNEGSLFNVKSNSLTIESSMIISNSGSDYLIYNLNGNVILNYDLIKDNAYELGLNNSNINLEYNLWGEGDKPSEILNWIVLDAQYDVNDSIYGDEINITVLFKATDANGQISDISKNLPNDIEVNITSPSGNIFKGFTKDGNATIPYMSNINEREVTINAADEEIVLPIILKNIRIDLGEINVGESLLINITVPGATGSVTFIMDGKKETLLLSNGVAQKTISNLTAGNHILKAYYPNDLIQSNSYIREFTVDKLESAFKIEDLVILADETADLIIVSDNNLSGEFYAIVNGNKVYSEIKDGINHIYIDDLPIGNYTFEVYYSGNYKYLPSNNQVSINVNGHNTQLAAEYSNVDMVAVISIKLNDDINGIVNVILNKTTYPTIIKDGIGICNISNLSEGTYLAFIEFNGNGKYLANKTNITFDLFKTDISSSLKYDFNIIESTSKAHFVINLVGDASGELILVVDNVENYTGIIYNGQAEINTTELTIGNHDIYFIYPGNYKYRPFTSQQNEINIPKITHNVDNVFADEGSSYSIKLPSDAEGTLSIIINNVVYKSEIVKNGVASVSIGDLAPGNYDISIVYSGDDKYDSIVKNISVNIPNPHIPIIKVVGKDMSMLYSSGANYRVRVTTDNQPVVGKTVRFVINGKTVTKVTDINGYASVKIDLPPKNSKYSVSATYNGVKISNSIKVNGIVSAKNMKVKKSAKLTKIKVSLKKVNNKFLKGKTIKIKFNGKTYKVKTNKKGVATWKVKKSMLKKLKVGKKYKYKVTYGKNTLTKKLTIRR